MICTVFHRASESTVLIETMQLMNWQENRSEYAISIYSAGQGFKLHSTMYLYNNLDISIDFSLTVKAATLIFISGRGSAISSAKEGKSGFIYNLVKS